MANHSGMSHIDEKAVVDLIFSKSHAVPPPLTLRQTFTVSPA